MNTNINKASSETNTSLPIRKRMTFKDKLVANMPQKLVALACSLLLFVVVLSDRNRTLEFDEIPVAVELPDGFVSTKGTQQYNVNVALYGRSSLLKNIRRDDIGVITLNPPPTVGNIQVNLNPDMISLPDGVHVSKFTPDFISLDLEPLDRRTVSITTDHAFTGELPAGYQIGEVIIKPESVEISGPRSLIAETSQLYIEPIDLTGKASTFTINRWVILNRVGVQAASPEVQVTVNIVAKSQQHVFRGIRIEPNHMIANYEFVPSTIDLTLTGNEEALSKIDTSRLFITVDTSQDQGRTGSRVLTAKDFIIPNLPEGVKLDESKMPSVLFKFWTEDKTKPAETQEP